MSVIAIFRNREKPMCSQIVFAGSLEQAKEALAKERQVASAEIVENRFPLLSVVDASDPEVKKKGE